MKLNIPERIKIGAHWYSVSYDSTLSIKYNFAGTTNFPTLQITLDNADEKPRSVLEETFVHEILHTAMIHSGFYKSETEPFQISEEELIGRLAPILYQILVDNVLQKEEK